MFGIDDAISSVSNLASTVITRVWPDATEIEKAKMTLAIQQVQNEYNLILGQIDTNKVEASSTSMFVSGARPAAMWVCVSVLFYNSVGVSLLSWASLVWHIPAPPILPDTGATEALWALLGLGSMRSFDKLKGTATKKI